MRTTTVGAPKKQPKQPRKLPAKSKDDSLRQLAFDNTLQANIISSVKDGKIIMANKAAGKLLGYPIRVLVTMNMFEIFAIKELAYKRMLREKDKEGQSTAEVTVIKKSGRMLTCEIKTAVFADTDRVKKAITAITDIGKSIRKQQQIDIGKEKIVADNILISDALHAAKLAENNRWIKYIAKTSYDVMWDWDLKTGQIYVGDSVREVLGLTVAGNDLKYSSFMRYLLPDDKVRFLKKIKRSIQSSAKSWNDAFIITRSDGSLAATVSRASIVRDEMGVATRLIGATQDVSRLKELENQLVAKERIEVFNMASRLADDGIWDWNLVTNEFILGEGFENLLGFSGNEKGNIYYDWRDFIYHEDKPGVEKQFGRVLLSVDLRWEFACRFTRADKSIAHVFNRAIIIRDITGKACRMMGRMHDLDPGGEKEKKLALEIELRTKQLEETIEDAVNAARNFIGKELHDNVNQLLGASRMFIEMAKRGGKNSTLYLSRSSEYTMMAIEDIRKLTRGLSTEVVINLGLCAAIDNLIDDIMEPGKVEITFTVHQFSESSVSDKFKLNIYRMLQEQLNNILKHSEASTVQINLSQKDDTIYLNISDNGIGFDTSTKKRGIGIANLKSRAASVGGTLEIKSAAGKGCIVTAELPILA